MLKHLYIRPYFLVLILFLLITVVFLPVLDLPFSLMDTITYVLTNKAIHSLSFESISYVCFKPMIYFMPVTWLSHMLDYALFNTQPLGHHFTNLVLHNLNVLLVMFLSFLCLKHYFKRSSYTLIVVSFLIALFWGVHPLRVESVAWIANRKGLCVSFFSLLTCISYFSLNNRFNFRYFIFVFLFFLAVCSHPYAVPLPLIFIFFDCLYSSKTGNSIFKYAFSRITFYMPLFILSAFVSYLTLQEHYSINAVESDLLSTSFVELITGAFARCLFYINKSLFPFDLLPIYPFMKANIFSFSTILGILVSLSLLSSRFSRVYKVCFLTFILFLLPVMGFVQSGYFSHGDRWSYLSTLPFYILIGGACYTFFLSARKRFLYLLFSCFLTFVFVFYILQTRNFIHTWFSYDIFYQRCYDSFPNQSPYVLDGIITVNIMEKKFVEALDKALLLNELFPDYAISKEALVRVYFSQGNFDKTASLISNFENAKSVSSTDFLMLAQSYFATKNYAKALETAQKITYSLRHSSYLNSQIYIQALHLMAEIYQKKGDFNKASFYFQQVFEFDPSSIMFIREYAEFLLDHNRYREALFVAQTVYESDPMSVPSLLLYSSMCMEVAKKISDDVLLKKGQTLQSVLFGHLNEK